MASNTYGAIKLSTAEDVGAVLKKKTGSQDGYKPKEWADTINLMGLLPVRTASGSIAHFTDGADDVPLKSLTAQILPIQEGTGTPSPSNPRPISGTSVLNVEQRGLNIFDKKPFSDWVIKSPYIVLNDNLPKKELLTMVFIDKDTSVDISGCYLGFVKDTYNGGTVQNEDYHWTLQNGTIRGRTDNVAEIGTDLCNYLMMYPTNEATYNKIFSRFDIMILAGVETSTTYAPYTGSTYAVNLGQTIYGGSVDVVGGVGENAWAKVAWQDLTVQQYSGHIFQAIVSGIKAPTTSEERRQGILSNNIAVCPTTALNDTMTDLSMLHLTDKVYIKIESASTNEEAKAILGDGYLVYELATPTDFTFTGQPINSYLGVNNVWADSGEVLDVEYRADMNILIAELGG